LAPEFVDDGDYGSGSSTVDLLILSKVRDLDQEISARNSVFLCDDADDGEMLLNLCGLHEPHELAALTDENLVEIIVGEIEQLLLEVANLGNQARRLRDRAHFGLRRHIDNLINGVREARP
jgi:hypothetical protein